MEVSFELFHKIKIKIDLFCFESFKALQECYLMSYVQNVLPDRKTGKRSRKINMIILILNIRFWHFMEFFIFFWGPRQRVLVNNYHVMFRNIWTRYSDTFLKDKGNSVRVFSSSFTRRICFSVDRLFQFIITKNLKINMNNGCILPPPPLKKILLS